MGQPQQQKSEGAPSTLHKLCPNPGGKMFEIEILQGLTKIYKVKMNMND